MLRARYQTEAGNSAIGLCRAPRAGDSRTWWIMGRDKVLGLSLAILVIGFAAAFCFRNEQFMQDGLQLARSSFLDDAVAERPGPKPYADSKQERKKPSAPTVTLKDIESIEAAGDARVAKNTGPASAKKSARRTKPARDIQVSLKTPISSAEPADEPPPNPEPASQPLVDATPQPAPSESITAERITAEQITANEPPARAPDTTNQFETTPEIVIRPGLRHAPTTDIHRSREMTWQPVVEKRERPATEAHATAKTKTDEAPAEIIHRVKRGDTLTRIAKHYLGDGNRYMEIYSANKDKLQSPDDRLRIGMMLRIPKTSTEVDPVIGPTASKRGVPFQTGVATRQRRSRTASIRNVSRSRKLPQPPRVDKGKDTDKATPSEKYRTADDSMHAEERKPPAQTASGKTPAARNARPAEKKPAPEAKTTKSNVDDSLMTPQPDTKIKFVPVRRSPFLPGKTESSSPNGAAGRTLSQKLSEEPPADASQKDSLRSDDPDVSGLDNSPRRTTTASKVGGKFEDVQLR
jgi:nucleoid-associated protein YgaU